VQFTAAGWTVAGKAYWRSGLPFSVLNNNAENALSNGTGNGTVLADVLDNHFNHSCTSFSNPCFQTPGIFNGTGLTTDNNGISFPRRRRTHRIRLRKPISAMCRAMPFMARITPMWI